MRPKDDGGKQQPEKRMAPRSAAAALPPRSPSSATPGVEERAAAAKQNDNSTWCSQAVTHPSTNQAQRCLTSVIGRELVFSTWYGRCRERKANMGLKRQFQSISIFSKCAAIMAGRKKLELALLHLSPEQIKMANLKAVS